MQQQNFDFYFSRPMTFFGSFQHLEDEAESEDDFCMYSEIFPFSLDIDPKYPTQQTIGLYLHWFDS